MRKLNLTELEEELEVLQSDRLSYIKGGDDGFDGGYLPEVYIPSTGGNQNPFSWFNWWNSYYGTGYGYGGGDGNGNEDEGYGGNSGGSYYDNTAQGSGGWLNSPVGEATISSEFNSHRTCAGCSQTHGGTDYSVPINTPVVATAPGTVARAYNSSTYGNVVVVNHGASAHGGGNVYTLYAHGNSLVVQQGQTVGTGDLLIYSGNTGMSTGPHLHYEVIVTSFTPFEPGFFGNLNIRYGPEELGYFLGQ